jgi:hypothetical protein
MNLARGRFFLVCSRLLWRPTKGVALDMFTGTPHAMNAFIILKPVNIILEYEMPKQLGK